MNWKLTDFDERTQKHFKERTNYNEKLHCVTALEFKHDGIVYTYRFKIIVLVVALLLLPFLWIWDILKATYQGIKAFGSAFINSFPDYLFPRPKTFFVEDEEIERERDEIYEKIRKRFSR